LKILKGLSIGDYGAATGGYAALFFCSDKNNIKFNKKGKSAIRNGLEDRLANLAGDVVFFTWLS